MPTELELGRASTDEAVKAFARPNDIWLDAAVTVYIKRKDMNYLVYHEEASTAKKRVLKASKSFMENEDTLRENLAEARRVR